VNTNINFPNAPFLDQFTQKPSLPWLLWLQNPTTVGITVSLGIAPTSGGTGTTAIPTNGQLLIGNGSNYNLNTLSNGSGIGITNGAGTISVANTGVLSNIAGTGISVSSATGNVTIANTGVTSFKTMLSGLTPSTASTGAVTLAGTLGVPSGGSGATTLTGYLKGNGTSPFTASTTIPYTDISGGLSVTITTAKLTSGGTNGSMTFTNGILTAQIQAT
jgi:hypothetical protein